MAARWAAVDIGSGERDRLAAPPLLLPGLATDRGMGSVGSETEMVVVRDSIPLDGMPALVGPILAAG